ncbi:MAG: hypothetical protein IKF14_18450 [Atopobiaceae bacterium]|nr:hypothetical protein [Atopobiaceae bacterium]MBR3161071.1 hypothetical protein [Atopobiaceae bacterium]
MNSEQAKAIITIIVTAVVNIANVCGFAMDADAWINVALSVLSAATILYSWWKNQNLTPEAVQAQELLDELKGK